MRCRLPLFLALCVVLMLLGHPAALRADTDPASPVPSSDAGMPMLGGNPARTGEQPGPGPTGAPATRWEFSMEAELASAPVLVGGTAYLSGDDGMLYAINTISGQERWRVQVGGYQGSAPAVVDGTVYVGGEALYAVDAETGAERWHVVGDIFEAAPAVVDSVVYATGMDGSVIAVDATTGATTWETTIGGELLSAPAVADGTVYVATFEGTVVALEAATGAERWRVLTDDIIDSNPAVADGVVYIHSHGENQGANLAGSARTTLHALDATTGAERWRFDAAGGNSTASSPAVAGGMVYVGIDRYLFGVDVTTGREQWSLATGNEVRDAPTVVDETVYVGSDALYAVDALTGQEYWRAAPAALPPDAAADVQASFRYGAPTVVDGVAYVASSLSAATYSGPDPWLPAVLHAVAGSDAPAVPGPLHVSPCGPPTVLRGEAVSTAIAMPPTTPIATPAASASVLGGNPARAGERQGPDPDGAPVLLWRAEISDLTLAAPALADDQLFVVTMDGVLAALDAVTGQEQWRADVDVSRRSPPAAADGTVYVGAADEALYALDATNGDPRWGVPTVGSVHVAPAVVDEMVVFGTASGSPFTGNGSGILYAVDAASGVERWSVEVAGPILAPPEVAGGLVYARISSGCGGSGFLAAVDATTGRPQWRAGIADPGPPFSGPVVAGDTVYVTDTFALVALDDASGRERWRLPDEFSPEEALVLPVGAPVATSSSVYFIDQVGAVVALDAASGQERWRVEVPGVGGGVSPVLADDELYVSAGESLLLALDVATGDELWRIDLGGSATTSPVVLGGVIYVGGVESDGESSFLAAFGEPRGTATPVS